MLREDDAREPRVLEWDEQDRLMRELPTHVARMVLFSLNTGCRQDEVCGLRWDEERSDHFLLSKDRTKSRRARRVPLNGIARRIIDDCRGEHDERVFVYRGNPVRTINNTAWKKARDRAGLAIRVHDLRHSFAVRLREAGVHAWTISALLGHQSRTITEHYAQPRTAELLEAVERLCVRPETTPRTALKLRAGGAKNDITPLQ
jgi:integrase